VYESREIFFEFVDRFTDRLNVGDEALCARPSTVPCVEFNDRIDLRIRYNLRFSCIGHGKKMCKNGLWSKRKKNSDVMRKLVDRLITQLEDKCENVKK
jgi:hypothetical protein